MCDSTLDLVWENFAATIQNTFLGTQVNWKGSVGLDHALIHTIASIPLKVKYRKEDYTNHFNMNISVDEWKSGQVYFDNSSPLYPPSFHWVILMPVSMLFTTHLLQHAQKQ